MAILAEILEYWQNMCILMLEQYLNIGEDEGNVNNFDRQSLVQNPRY